MVDKCVLPRHPRSKDQHGYPAASSDSSDGMDEDEAEEEDEGDYPGINVSVGACSSLDGGINVSVEAQGVGDVQVGGPLAAAPARLGAAAPMPTPAVLGSKPLVAAPAQLGAAAPTPAPAATGSQEVGLGAAAEPRTSTHLTWAQAPQEPTTKKSSVQSSVSLWCHWGVLAFVDLGG